MWTETDTLAAIFIQLTCTLPPMQCAMCPPLPYLLRCCIADDPSEGHPVLGRGPGTAVIGGGGYDTQTITGH